MIWFERDMRWATHKQAVWKPVDIDSLKLYNDTFT